MMRLVFLLALAGCPSKKQTGEACTHHDQCNRGRCVVDRCATGLVGGDCATDYDCTDGSTCFEKKCRTPGKRGEACRYDGDCDHSLGCYRKRCMAHDERKAADTQAAIEQRKVDAANAEKMVAQQTGSGVAEQPANAPPPTTAGGQIRTVTFSAKSYAVAACKPDERLVGGGCKHDHVLSSYPGGGSSEDTVGGRWNCHASNGEPVTAYALCTKL